MEHNSVTSFLKQYSDEASTIQEAIKAMHSPWADIENIGSSIAGFAETQSIGYALKNIPSFDESLTEALRLDLGDWRTEISWPKEIFVNPLARTEFYTERGFNSGLTMFP